MKYYLNVELCAISGNRRHADFLMQSAHLKDFFQQLVRASGSTLQKRMRGIK